MAFTSPVPGSIMARAPIAWSVGATWLRTEVSAARWKRGSMVVWIVRPPV